MKKIAELKYNGNSVYDGMNNVGKTLVNTFGFEASDAINVYGDHLRYSDKSSGLLVIKGMDPNKRANNLMVSIYGPKMSKFEGKSVAKALEKFNFSDDSKLVPVKNFFGAISKGAYSIANGFLSAIDYENKVRDVPDLTSSEQRENYLKATEEPIVVPGGSLRDKLLSFLPQKGQGPIYSDEVLPPLVKKVEMSNQADNEPILLTNGRPTVDMTKLIPKADAYIAKLDQKMKLESQNDVKNYQPEISELDLVVLQNMDWNVNDSTEMVDSQNVAPEIKLPDTIVLKGDYGTNIVSLEELNNAPSFDERETEGSVKAENPLDKRF